MPQPPDPAELPNAELEVLAFLWKSGPRTARHVQDGLAGQRPMSDGATVALLKRLEAKGFVRRHKVPGEPILYTATRKADPAYRRIARNFVQRVFGGDGAQLVVSLLEGCPPTDDELDRIEAALKRLKQERRSSELKGGRP